MTGPPRPSPPVPPPVSVSPLVPVPVPVPVPVMLTPVLGMPEVRSGDDLAALILDALTANGIELVDGDVLVVSSKVVSKALGLTAAAQGREAAVAQESRRVVAERRTPAGLTRIVAAVSGPVMAGAGVDASNTGGVTTSSGEDAVLLLPADPDACARDLLAAMNRAVTSGPAISSQPTASGPPAAGPAGLQLGVVISDTAGRAWRVGQTDFALGAAGVTVLDDLRGVRDVDGVAMQVTMRAVADEIAAAADLVKGKVAAVPVAHVRGLGAHVIPVAQDNGPAQHTGAADLLRDDESDWFAMGHLEAVRAALGVSPGSALSERLGIASTLPEDVETQARRALAVALNDHALTGDTVTGDLTLTGIRLQSSDLFALGATSARLVVALSGEGIEAGADPQQPGGQAASREHGSLPRHPAQQQRPGDEQGPRGAYEAWVLFSY